MSVTSMYESIQSKILRILINRVDLHKVYLDYGPFPINSTLLENNIFAKKRKLPIDDETEPRWKSSNIVNMLMSREKGQFSSTNFSSKTKCNIYNRCVPNKFDILVGYPGDIYCSQFTKDGRYFITASDDLIRIYDSTNECYNIEKSMDVQHFIDLECSPDNEHLVYYDVTPKVYLCKITDGYNEQIPLVVDEEQSSIILSLSISVDGRELLCGDGDGTIYIYDLKSDRRSLKFLGHKYCVNTATFADDSNNVLYTAGYDRIVRLWDRRILSVNRPTPVGNLVGHKKDIIYMDLRGDGRHLITHSKDQSIKLWDVRRLTSTEPAMVQIVTNCTGSYYVPDIPVNDPTGLIDDTSIMTYGGHLVRETKISCRFSPVETTGQRYIYTGCDSGRVVVYEALTGEAVQHQVAHVHKVKNVFWHPTRNEIISSGWDGLVGIWTYMDPDNMIEPEQIKLDEKHFSSFKFQDGLLVNPDRRCHVPKE